MDRKLFGTSTIGLHPARPALRLLLMIRPARPSLAEVPLADLSLGDLVLRSLAVLLQGFRRGSDLPCRYGGEEFVLIMPQTTAAEAAARLEPLRERLATMGIHHEGRLLDPVTASIGVAEFPTDGGSFTALLAAADQSLYRAKREGRNRICRASQGAGSAATP